MAYNLHGFSSSCEHLRHDKVRIMIGQSNRRRCNQEALKPLNYKNSFVIPNSKQINFYAIKFNDLKLEK